VKFHFFETIRLHSAFVDIPLKYPTVIVDIAVNQEYIRLGIETDAVFFAELDNTEKFGIICGGLFNNEFSVLTKGARDPLVRLQ